MSAELEQGPIWPSYADLMTSLFAVGLVLFVLSYWLLTIQYKVPAKKWEKIEEITESVSRLADPAYFSYQQQYKRHVFKEEVSFATGDDVILPQYQEFITSAGRRIETLITDLKARAGVNIKYVMIIEGMASDDGFVGNYELSYRRALALYRFWAVSGVSFDPEICEVIIAGSGTGGVGRYSRPDERRNQRFLIQILPKVGTEGLLDSTQGSATKPTRPASIGRK